MCTCTQGTLSYTAHSIWTISIKLCLDFFGKLCMHLPILYAQLQLTCIVVQTIYYINVVYIQHSDWYFLLTCTCQIEALTFTCIFLLRRSWIHDVPDVLIKGCRGIVTGIPRYSAYSYLELAWLYNYDLIVQSWVYFWNLLLYQSLPRVQFCYGKIILGIGGDLNFCEL